MRRSPEQVARGELIGLACRVVASGHPPWVGLSGRIVDETKNTLVLAIDGREVRLPKRGCVFEVETADAERVTLSGDVIAHRPEDRVKKIQGT